MSFEAFCQEKVRTLAYTGSDGWKCGNVSVLGVSDLDSGLDKKEKKHGKLALYGLRGIKTMDCGRLDEVLRMSEDYL